MDQTWWPDLLRHIAHEDPWSEPMVTVAEVRGFDPPENGQRVAWTALVPPEGLERLKGKIALFNHEVEASGPHPNAGGAGHYRPRFWIEANLEDERIKFDPLVLGWQAHNRTAMVLDPGFTMTYGLMPRALGDGSLHWDDPAAPEYDVAVIDPPSHYQFPHCPTARTRVSRDHLQDFLSLTNRVLVQVFWEIRHGPEDKASADFLGDENHRDVEFDDRTLDVRRNHGGGYTAQIWGARVLARPADLPITNDTLDNVGLTWPGISTPLSRQTASRLRFREDILYIRDEVLAAYEGRPDFKISPESGSVSCGNQWSVGYIRRVGRDLLQLEVRKLYEGTPTRVITHWHGFAVTPPPRTSLYALHQEPNVATRAKDLTDELIMLGRLLMQFANALGINDVVVADIVGMDPAKRDWNGWWNLPFVERITRHIPLGMSESEFLGRCLDLDKVAIEALGERVLRRMVNAMGAQPEANKFRGLKLLDRLVCLAAIADETGLPLAAARDEIFERFRESNTVPSQPLKRLFALSDLRQEEGHRKDGKSIRSALERCGLDPAATASGWGTTLDGIYDGAIGDIRHANAIIECALRN